MESNIVNSQFKLLGTAFNNSNITLDIGAIFLAISIIILSVTALRIIKYFRDKNNVVDSKAIEILQADSKYNLRYIKSLEQRVEYLENKDESVSGLYKLVRELKTLVTKK